MRPIRLALAGPMGSGKSTVGRLLAARWGVDFVDLDEDLGDIPAIFARDGEAAFRRRERAALVTRAGGRGVLALGGGTLVDPENLVALAGWRVCVLMGTADTLRARIGVSSSRPLAGDLEALLVARDAAWRSAGPVIATDGLEPGAVANRVEAWCASP